MFIAKISNKVVITVFLLSISFCFEMCQNKNSMVNDTDKKISEFVYTHGLNFKDPYGRDLILHGINVVNKDPKSNYVGHITPEEMTSFKSWGFNVIRLGIIWDGLEPEPGKYNEAYLSQMDEMIQWASENDLYIVLDMHQDLYSVKFSDGASEWATIDEGKPHYTGAIWSDSYLISPAVQTAFDNFWSNATAPDSIGIQDHYINAWKHVANRYADNTTVIGYDIMNEPFMGSEALMVMPKLLEAFAMVVAEETGQPPMDATALMEIWANEESRLEALKQIAEAEKYKKVIDAVYELNEQFERTTLTEFYQKVRDEIRRVDRNHILFLEHSYFSNTGIYSGIQPALDENGNPDPLQAYAPHGYDLLTDTKEVESPSFERVELIYSRIAETAKRLNMPVLLGEWGAYHSNSDKMVKTSDHAMGLIEKFNFSNTFWAYYRDIDSYAFFNKSIIKPYPSEISGELIGYNYDREMEELVCSWEEDVNIKKPTRFYIPALNRFSEKHVWIEPEADEINFESIPDLNSGYMLINPTGEGTSRRLKLEFSELEARNLPDN
jgi:endoglycosylceramidase